MIPNTAEDENNNTHHIHFDEEVHVHVHTVELGDHPDACHGGPPVQLGWRYSTRTSLLHDHTSKPVEWISPTQREDALIDCGVPRLHIHRAIVQAHRIRLSRIDSFNKSQRILSSASSSSSSSITTNKEKHATTTTKKHYTATSGVKHEYKKSRSAPTFPSVKSSTSTKPRPEEFTTKDNQRQRKNQTRKNAAMFKICAFVRTFPLHTKRWTVSIIRLLILTRSYIQ